MAALLNILWIVILIQVLLKVRVLVDLYRQLSQRLPSVEFICSLHGAAHRRRHPSVEHAVIQCSLWNADGSSLRTSTDVAEGRELDGFAPARGKVSKNLSVSYAIRLTPAEYEEFSAGARSPGMTLADFIRSSTRAALAGELDATKAAAAAEVPTKARELLDPAGRLYDSPSGASLVAATGQGAETGLG
jgi:hypothetical protein